MGQSSNIYNFSDGMRLVHKKMPGIRSISAGIMVAVGSANETKANNGISHFIEHVMFKGTNKRTAFDISCDIDSLGAQINAFTSKLATCYYTISSDEYVENCLEILSDLFFDSQFDNAELEKEKGVILEEISMSEDDPSDLCLENLSTAYFEGSKLGLTILGERKTVKSFNRDMVKEYIAKNYCADNTVISLVGNIEFEDAIALAKKYFEGRFTNKKAGDWRDKPHNTKSVNVVKIKDVEQANIAFALPSFPIGSEYDLAVMLVNAVFGSGMSSRLFQEIREKKGLAYSVFSYPSTYCSNGNFSIYLGTNRESAVSAIESVRQELIKLKEFGITQEELDRGKKQLKGSYTISQESSSSMMRLYSRAALFENKTFDFDARLLEIDNISMDKVNYVINSIVDFDKISASYVGKKIDGLNALNLVKGI